MAYDSISFIFFYLRDCAKLCLHHTITTPLWQLSLYLQNVH